MAGISPAIFFLVVFLIIIAAASIKILLEYERGVIFRRAEGEAQGAKKLAAAANIMSVYPAAMHVRFLQTLTKVAAEKNSTIILPLPIDLLTAFLQKKEKE